jgi:hypothetical protein
LRACALFACVVLVTPPEGFPGLEWCPAMRWTHAPCPGCGVTRSGSNLVRGNLHRAAEYNPFGLVLVPAVFGLGFVGLLPARCRRAFRSGVARQSRAAGYVGAVVLASLLILGWARWALVVFGYLPFPPCQGAL